MRWIGLLFLIVLAMACNNEHPEFVGSWELDHIEFNGNEIGPDEMGDPLYIFKPNGEYRVEIGTSAQVGTWDQEEEKLTLTDNANKAYSGEAQILVLNDSTFIYKIYGDGDSETNVFLNRKK